MQRRVIIVILALFIAYTHTGIANADDPFRAAIFLDPRIESSELAALSQRTVSALEKDGVEAVVLTSEQIAESAFFNADRFDLLVAPSGPAYPLSGKDALLDFIRRGGDLLCAGGYAFDEPLLFQDGAWISARAFWKNQRDAARDAETSTIPNGGFENGSEGWSTLRSECCSITHDEFHTGGTSALVRCKVGAEGARWERELSVRPGSTYLVGAHAKALGLRGGGYGYLAVYQYDAKGDLLRFIDFAQLWRSSDWRRYESIIEIHPQAARIAFYGGLFNAGGAMQFDDVTLAEITPEDGINAHFGKPADGLINTQDQLPLFSQDQCFEGASLGVSPNAPIELQWSAKGNVRGFEATAQTRGRARWTPFVDAFDESGRFSGSAGAFVDWFAGPYSGSRWTLFGVENRDFFEGSEGERLLLAAARRHRAGVFVKPLETGYAFYQRGEEAEIRCEFRNDSRSERRCEIELQFHSPDASAPVISRATRIVSIPANANRLETFRWAVPADAPDFVKITVLVRVGGDVVDRCQSGFCAADRSVLLGAPHIRYSNNAFEITGSDGATRRVCLWGTDTYGNYFGSNAHSPLTWFNELEAMRSGGLHLFENLQWIPKESRLSKTQWRQLDAFIQLSQRFSLPYMAGLLIGQNVAVEDDALERQAEYCRQFAARYKNIPGLIYYLNGDFQLQLKDGPDMRRLWNQFLRERYPSSEALRKAWNAEVPDIGSVPLENAVAVRGVYDVRKRDRVEFEIQLTQRWVETLCRAIRSEDAEHPITSEYYQKPSGGLDLRLTLGSMDAANFGYFDRPQWDVARLMATIKSNDMSRYGKTVNIGEFGVKTHEAWALERGGGHYHIQRTDRERNQLFWWVAHAAWGLGATKIQNWCWSDAPESVFPWGVAWNNPLRAKPVMKLYRNLRLLSDRMPVDYRPSSTVFVMPDGWRLGAPETLALTSIHNAIECLLAADADFDTVNQFDLSFLEDRRPDVIVAPLAYAMSDEAIAQLRSAVERGSTLYLSGDVAMTPDGNSDPSRLEQICGVVGIERLDCDSGLPYWRVRAGTPAEQTNPAGLPLFERKLGRGRILYSPQPWEAMPGVDVFVDSPEATADPSVNLYLSLFGGDGAVASGGVWRRVEKQTGGNRWFSVFPRSEIEPNTKIDVSVGGATFTFLADEAFPAGVLLNGDGGVIAATGSKALQKEGKTERTTFVEGVGPWTALSLTCEPLTATDRLAISAMDAGTIRWKSAVENLTAVMVDWREGKAYASASIPLIRRDGYYSLNAAPNELYLIAPQSNRQEALKALDFCM